MSKSSENKKIAKNTLFLYFRSIIIIIVSLYTSRLILEVLGIDDYGIYNIVGGVVAMFSLLSSSMVSACQRFITYAIGKNEEGGIRNVFITSVSIHIVLGAIIVTLLEIVGVWFLYNGLNIPKGRLDAAFWVLQCSILAFFINIISIPYNALIIAHEKMSAFAYISLFEVFCKLLIVYILFVISVDKLILYALLLTIVAIGIRIIYTSYCRKKFVESRNYQFKIDKDLFKEMFSFSIWNMWGTGSLLLRNQGVDILLNIFFGVTVNAAKGVANQVQSAVHQFVTNFQTAVNPQLTKSIAQQDLKRNHQLIIQGSRYSFYLMLLFGIPLMVSASEILSLWLVEVPVWTTEFIQWTCVYMLWDCLSRFLINSILASGKIRNYEIVVGGTKLLVVPIVWIVLLLGGSPITGIIINIIIEWFCLAERLYFNHKYTHFPIGEYVKKAIVLCWVVFVVAFLPSWFFHRYTFDSLFISVPFSALATVGVIWLLGITNNERQFVRGRIKAIIKR